MANNIDNENKLLIFWDALEHGSNTLIEAEKSLNRLRKLSRKKISLEPKIYAEAKEKLENLRLEFGE